jgi:hypothetical protein
MGKDVEVIWVKRTPEYFYEKGWTGDSVICPSGQREPTFRNVFSLTSRSSNRAGTPEQTAASGF